MTVIAEDFHKLLPQGIRSRIVDNSNGLDVHILEAGFEDAGRPCLLLLHGFPELAFSWRKVMPALAAAGYHVIAPDQRGYGRTTGWEPGFDCDLGKFGMLNLVRDAIGLLHALGRQSVTAVIGHDFGSPVAAYCALLRPDIFKSVALMSAPFGGAPALPPVGRDTGTPVPDIHDALANLERPRKHYQHYYSTRAANDDMWRCPQGVHAFLRAYYHFKSADWIGNRPFALASWSADELAKMPTYYIMDLASDMAETVRPEMPAPAAINTCKWLSEPELRYYSATYERTGFQGGLNWYRCGTDPEMQRDLEIFAGVKITVPACFIAGASDWGIHQKPGTLDAMQTKACARFEGLHLVPDAGHWVQQEQPEAVAHLLVQFLKHS